MTSTGGGEHFVGHFLFMLLVEPKCVNILEGKRRYESVDSKAYLISRHRCLSWLGGAWQENAFRPADLSHAL